MSATLSAEPRRTDPLNAAPPRELPVLFHLMDVSRAKVTPPSRPPSRPEKVSAAPVSTVTAPTSAAKVEVPKVAAPPTFAPPPPAVAPAPSMAKAVTNPAKAVAPAEKTESKAAADISMQFKIDSPPTPTDARPKGPTEQVPTEPPTLAHSPPEKRPAKAKPRTNNDWFTNQGKYIAIGFVLALIGTIYLARTGRGTRPAVVAEPHAHPGDAGAATAPRKKKATTVVNQSKERAKPESQDAAAAATSPARLADAPVPEKSPQADLHPPTIPQLVREPAATTHPDNNALFPWVEQPGDRLASRPAAPTQAPSPGAAPASQPQYPVTAAGAPTSPAYPVTSAPNSNFVAPTDQQTAGAANTSPYLPAAPAVQPPPGQNFVPPPAGASPYLPPDNTARGYRYERTGSGPY